MKINYSSSSLRRHSVRCDKRSHPGASPLCFIVATLVIVVGRAPHSLSACQARFMTCDIQHKFQNNLGVWLSLSSLALTLASSRPLGRAIRSCWHNELSVFRQIALRPMRVDVSSFICKLLLGIRCGRAVLNDRFEAMKSTIPVFL